MTSIALMAFLGFPVTLFVEAIRQQSATIAAGAFAALVIFAGIVIQVARYHYLRGYTVSRDSLVINRFGPDIHLELDELVHAEADPKAMAWTLSMNNGGFFSFGGKCWNRRLRSYVAYATDPKLSVVLRFPDSRVVITPENPVALTNFIAKSRG